MQTKLLTPILGTIVMGATLLSPALWAEPRPFGPPLKNSPPPDAGSGRSYTIERAPAITGPRSTLSAQTAPASGLLEYDDTSPSPGSAFYRTVQP